MIDHVFVNNLRMHANACDDADIQARLLSELEQVPGRFNHLRNQVDAIISNEAAPPLESKIRSDYKWMMLVEYIYAAQKSERQPEKVDLWTKAAEDIVSTATSELSQW